MPSVRRNVLQLNRNRKYLPIIRTRFVYIIVAVVVVTAGLASRSYRGQLPRFLAEYAGDTLWALMLFLMVSMLLAGRSLLVRAAISLALAFLVEISQLYHAPWIDSIRQTRLGGLVLGFGFLWTDLICYSAGIAIGAFTEWGIGRVRGPNLEKISGR
jgi:hypothetical protein